MKPPSALAENRKSVTPPPPTNVLVGRRPNPRPTASGIPPFPSSPPSPIVSAPRGDAQAFACPPTATLVSGATPQTGSAAPSPRRAFEHNQRGAAYFNVGLYAEASEDFRKAVTFAGSADPNLFVYVISLANASQIMWLHDESETLYNAVADDKDAPANLAASAQDELRKLAVRRQQGIPQLRGDERLLRIAAQLIYKYPNMRRAVNLYFVGESAESLNRIIEIQEAAGIAPSNQVRTLAGWTAVGHIIGDEHWIFVKDAWMDASDSAVKGLLSHEFAHEELKDTQSPYVVHPDQSHLGLVCNERATDLLAIAKGFGGDLLESRRYMEESMHSLEHESALMNPQEIRFLLDSPAARRAEASFQMRFAAGLGQELGRDSAVVQEEFRKAVPLWERVIATSPQYAHGHRELAVAYQWLGELRQALRCANTAVELEPSNAEYRQLVSNLETELRERNS